MKADADDRIKALQTANEMLVAENARLKQRLNKELIDNAVTAAAKKAGAPEQALTDVALRARNVWKLDEEGNPVAYNGDRPIYGKDPSKPLSMDEYMEGLAKEAPHLFEENSGRGDPGRDGRLPEGGVLRAGHPDLGRSLEDIAAGRVQVLD